jgi:hypothetical protein
MGILAFAHCAGTAQNSPMPSGLRLHPISARQVDATNSIEFDGIKTASV